jgi:hypothetical protein
MWPKPATAAARSTGSRRRSGPTIAASSRRNLLGVFDRRLERVSDVQELLELAEPLGPRTIYLVDALLEQPRRQRRVWVARATDRTITGALVLSRLCLDRWLAFPLVLDESAVPALAAKVGRSPAYLVTGLVEDVDPVVASVRRAAGVTTLGMAAYGPTDAHDVGRPADDRVRPGRPSDLAALVALYAGYELDLVPSIRRLRAGLRRDLARGWVMVAEVDGRLAGATRVEAGTPRFHHWSHLTVLPEYRGHKLGVELSVGACWYSEDVGRAYSAARHPTNPSAPPRPTDRWGDSDPWYGRLRAVRLRRRVPAINRLRRLIELAEGARRRRPTQQGDPERWQRTYARRDEHGWIATARAPVEERGDRDGGREPAPQP